jgi:hypothetical protein
VSFDWAKAASAIGGTFRFGRGVMGKSALLALAVVGVCGMAVWRLPPSQVLVGLGAAVGVFVLWFLKIIDYASKHPDAALLEGAEWSAYKRFEAKARSLPSPPADLPISDPTVVTVDATLLAAGEPEQED